MTNNQSTGLQTLHEARVELFKRAKRRWYGGAILGTVIITISIFAATMSNIKAIVPLGVVSLLLSLIAFLLRDSAHKTTDLAEMIRRRALYADGLGLTVVEEDLLEISDDVKRVGISADLKPYFASEKDVGLYRLNENIKESAYFTWKLSQLVGTSLKIFSSLVILTSLGFLYFAANQPNPTMIDWLPTIAKVVVLILAIIIGGDFNSIAKSYKHLSSGAERVYRRAARLNRRRDLDTVDVLITGEDYSVALIQAPPIPTWLHQWRRDSLNAAYQNATANEHDDSS